MHDAGKLHPGFQAKGWPQGLWKGSVHGHVVEGTLIFEHDGPAKIAASLCLHDLREWGVDPNLLYASLSHHGRPLKINYAAENLWYRVGGYDPFAATAEMGAMMRRWFPAAFAPVEEPLPATEDFQHYFCGLVSLADWIGSDQRIFDFVEVLDPDYIIQAREKARRAVSDIGLDTTALEIAASGRATFPVLTGLEKPRPQQQQAAEYSLDERIVVLEAETGSGKTEAALWRFARLFEGRRVDSLYFALPTRAAAIHSRFAPEDRKLLDEAVEAALSPQKEKRSPHDVIVIGTQTLEQSLDIVEASAEARWRLPERCGSRCFSRGSPTPISGRLADRRQH